MIIYQGFVYYYLYRNESIMAYNSYAITSCVDTTIILCFITSVRVITNGTIK